MQDRANEDHEMIIPRIDIAPLFGPPAASRDIADRAVMDAASTSGFMTITGFHGAEMLTPENRRRLLAVFTLPEEEKRRLWRWNFDHSQPNVYRGWYPLQKGTLSQKEGIDMGPDLAHGPARIHTDDPLAEETPLPPEEAVPGWRDIAAGYYRAIEETGAAVMRSLARGLGLEEIIFDAAFENGVSTLRLTRYPFLPEVEVERPEEHFVVHAGKRRAVIGGAHVDSGFVTLLAQDGVEGLQAQARSGEWIDVPPVEGTLAVNFGKLLERWTGGRVKATLHRVISPERERFSMPFFYEPAADAEIAPLRIAGAEPFEPFLYGDHVWEVATNFVELRGVKHLRQPRRQAAS
jgi:isopenicillin N synthase-like dioxygenase